MSAALQMTVRRSASARTSVAVIAVVMSVAALTGCTIDTAEPDAGKTATPAPAQTEPSTTLTGEERVEQEKIREACAAFPVRGDTGARGEAQGTVYESDGEGLATVYTLASGDTLEGIANRFCLDLEELYARYQPSTITLLAGEHVALQKEYVADARRASGYLFPACPADDTGYPIVASIGWEPIEDNSPISRANITGAPIDTGTAYGAKGAARSNAAGELIDYTVAPNDNWRSIRDRFCFDLYYMASLTGGWADDAPVIHPGDVIPMQPQYREINTGAPPAD